MAGLTHHFLLNPLVGQPFLGSEGEDGHDKIKAKRYGSGSGWSALYDLLESILAPRSNAGCRPSERQKIEAVSDVLIKTAILARPTTTRWQRWRRAIGK